MKLLLMGPQGAGKGTVATILKKHFDIPHISMGDLLRETLVSGSLVAKEIKSYMDQGLLVPLTVIKKMLQDRLSHEDCGSGFILDGFPRDKDQADVLDDIVNIDFIVVLEVSREVSIHRLGNRVQCKNCGSIYNLVTMLPAQEGICDECGGELYQREDDKASAIEKRLSIYESETKPLIERYKSKAICLDTSKDTPEEVANTIITKILQK